MKNSLFIFLFIFVVSIASSAQTYGNWSGILYTGDSKSGVNDQYFNSYSKGLQEYLKKAYKDQYVRLITYVVKKGQRYTVSIKYPQDGVDRNVEFTCYHPEQTKGFYFSYQNLNRPGKYMAQRVNFTNSTESDYEKVIVIVSTVKPGKAFYLRIEYPAVADNLLINKTVNPAYPEFGPMYWGTVEEEPILLK
jgi:hypothetical protein